MELIKITRQPGGRLVVTFKTDQGIKSRRYKNTDSARTAQLRRVLSPTRLREHREDPSAVPILAEHQLAISVLEHLNAW